MTKKDKELIKKAEQLNPIYWYDVREMVNEAETDQAKEELTTIYKAMYHKEEALNDEI